MGCRLVVKWRGAFGKVMEGRIQARWTGEAMFAEVSAWAESFKSLMNSVKGRRLFKVSFQSPRPIEAQSRHKSLIGVNGGLNPRCTHP